MKRILAVLIFAVSWAAQAAPVTIDFNEVTPQTNYAIHTAVTSKGYDFVTGGGICGGAETESGVSANGIFIVNPAPEPAICGNTISMQRSDAGAFAIHSFDVFGATGYYSGFTPYSGTLIGGGAANLNVAIGTGDWLNLKNFSVRAENLYFNNLRLDTVVVSAVPVPAAVWLFISALGLLGVQRRIRDR